MKNLWPDDINVDEAVIKTPSHILRQQASLLGQKTRNLVKARVYHKQEGENFSYRLELVGNIIEYDCTLLTISHGIEIYPVEIKAKELVEKVENENQFIETLREILNLASTKKLIRAIIAQSVSFEKIESPWTKTAGIFKDDDSIITIMEEAYRLRDEE